MLVLDIEKQKSWNRLVEILEDYSKYYIKSKLVHKGFKGDGQKLEKVVEEIFGKHIESIPSTFLEALENTTIDMDINEFLKTEKIK